MNERDRDRKRECLRGGHREKEGERGTEKEGGRGTDKERDRECDRERRREG